MTVLMCAAPAGLRPQGSRPVIGRALHPQHCDADVRTAPKAKLHPRQGGVDSDNGGFAMVRNHGRKQRASKARERTGRGHASAAAGTLHQHRGPVVPPIDASAFGRPGLVRMDAVGQLVGAVMDGCRACQEALADRVLDGDRVAAGREPDWFTSSRVRHHSTIYPLLVIQPGRLHPYGTLGHGWRPIEWCSS
ncbi:hypothetical protein [Nonomuraea aurantiaca]|uniref:hypothetical protein n=1 Tax=Nonomuraea aurantiaca TaxID=2878562 RepID=UPI001CD997EB|nr:hypothetical protein [Nonomuraea aurantiaca]MCA2225866.1 hypothetical protein [Nonomuraea aurantiaca]